MLIWSDQTRRRSIMQQNQRLNRFVQEIEHGLYGRTYTWEGKPEQVLDLGEVVVHAQPQFALVLCLCFASAQIDERLDHITHQIEKHFVQRQLWVIGRDLLMNRFTYVGNPNWLREHLFVANFWGIRYA